MRQANRRRKSSEPEKKIFESERRTTLPVNVTFSTHNHLILVFHTNETKQTPTTPNHDPFQAFRNYCLSVVAAMHLCSLR